MYKDEYTEEDFWDLNPDCIGPDEGDPYSLGGDLYYHDMESNTWKREDNDYSEDYDDFDDDN